MSQLKKFVFLAVSVVVLSRLAYAGIVNISDTEFSSSGTRMSAPGSTGSSGSHTSTTSGVTCGDVTAATAEGCNAALGISSGAVATACDGGLYTCSLPPATRAENPACDSGAKGSAAECSAQRATAVACGSEGKYNCVCDGVYTQSCNSADNKYPDLSIACSNSKGEIYIPSSEVCLERCRAEGNGFSLYDSEAAANSGCDGKGLVTKCWSNASGTTRWQCDRSCATVAKLPDYRGYQQSSGDCSEYNGEASGITCGDGVNLCRCNTSAYMSNFDALATCASGSGMRPLVDNPCTAENPLKADKTCLSDANGDGICDSGKKYQNGCGYPNCSNTDMTMMNTVYCDGSGWHKTIGGGNIDASNLNGNYYSLDSSCSENNAASGLFSGGTQEEYFCTIPNNATCGAVSNIILQRAKVCSCASTYKYVPADTTFSAAELTSLGVTKCGSGEVPLALASKDDTAKAVCIWNAQTSIVANSSSDANNGKKNAMDASRIRYGNKCLRKCEAWESGIPEMTGDTCAEGLTMGVCAVNKGDDSTYGVTIPLYYEHKYCTCPRDSETGDNLYKDSCPAGQYLGARPAMTAVSSVINTA